MEIVGGNFLFAIAKVLDTILWLYLVVVIVSALLSWVNPDPYNPIVRILRNLTEPVFYRVRRLLPFTNIGGIDFTPVLVILVIYFLRNFFGEVPHPTLNGNAVGVYHEPHQNRPPEQVLHQVPAGVFLRRSRPVMQEVADTLGRLAEDKKLLLAKVSELEIYPLSSTKSGSRP